MDEKNIWKVCSNCKTDLPFHGTYYICNVSTCNQKRTGWVFCSVECWDTHVPKMNHKESWAIEKKAPTFQEWQASKNATPEPRTRNSEDKSKAKLMQPQKTVIIRRSGKTS